MRPLRVALVNRAGSVPGERTVGWWAYDVPEFAVERFVAGRGDTMDRADFRAFDLILWEDGKSTIYWTGYGPPLAYHIVDSTLSADAYEHRLKMGEQADLILVDWDRLERFACLKKPVARFNHCVNDRLFRDYSEGKTVDIAFHMAVKGNPERAELRDWLRQLCISRGWTMESGVIGGEDYARSFSRAKVTLNMERTPTTRAHRVFDAMACRTCLLTTPEPDVSGEERKAGVHYVEWRDRQDLILALGRLLDDGGWERFADAGYELVQRRHTWAVRARELRAALAGIRGEWAE